MRPLIVASALVLLALGAGCRGSGYAPPGPVVIGGNPDRGRRVILSQRCGDCHTIPGVRGARGVVGVPLERFALRTFIAGEVPNTPDNLVSWILDPQRIEPHTAMPNLGLDEREARDAAAYLYTLR